MELRDVIGRQLVTDVPKCVLLSDGLDSSTIAALACKAMASETVRSFAVDFVDQAKHFVPVVGDPSMDAPFVHAAAGTGRRSPRCQCSTGKATWNGGCDRSAICTCPDSCR